MPITRGRQVVCPTWRRKIRTVPSRPSPTSGVLPKDENIPVLRRQNQSYNELTNIERMEEIRTANSIYPHLPQHVSSILLSPSREGVSRPALPSSSLHYKYYTIPVTPVLIYRTSYTAPCLQGRDQWWAVVLTGKCVDDHRYGGELPQEPFIDVSAIICSNRL